MGTVLRNRDVTLIVLLELKGDGDRVCREEGPVVVMHAPSAAVELDVAEAEQFCPALAADSGVFARPHREEEGADG